MHPETSNKPSNPNQPFHPNFSQVYGPYSARVAQNS
jgi:hypothetical protein